MVIDTLAAKYVDGFEGTEGLAPNLGRLAREEVVFKNAFSTAPWTRPAIASMLSGRLPADHGIERIKSRFRPNVKSIAEEFHLGLNSSHGINSSFSWESSY
ncbi:MAG: sulfatase-like hydrolase/transferase [SAR324 cluster bacterium]|uniref:Sulfatase-like hydrolase/transferase n=1 Tax=SAR324 cluster bacterium TaxID=2024889 RepID=A0A7X9FPR9_9DELT|nr:sulfatase-like hydrolase/transferase [SAR324 cluster bacterium]